MTIDRDEVAQFDAIADDWWDLSGPFAPLHKINPVRLSFIRNAAAAHFARRQDDQPAGGLLTGLTAVDVGCGGGLVSEPLARLGARVTGLDPSGKGLAAAREHAAGAGLTIDYRADTAEALVEAGAQFDLVVCLEVIEHVPDQSGFVKTLSALVAPGGLLVMSTLNRSLRAYALAIVAAERVLRWLPRGTHDWNRFVQPEELQAMLIAADLKMMSETGMVYNPLSDTWSLSADMGVNYLMSAVHAG